jgi:probable rRNA maturation factor
MEPRSRSFLAGAKHGPGDGLNGPSAEAEILIVDPRWRRLVPQVARLARRAAAAAGGAGVVMLDRDLRVRRLNARHRGRNKPTNVLTFENPPGIPGGDIVLALETVRREARAAGRRPAHHLAHLVVHGALHLRGHDHHGAGEARRMEMEEARILHALGVPNPWKPRQAGTATNGKQP